MPQHWPGKIQSLLDPESKVKCSIGKLCKKLTIQFCYIGKIASGNQKIANGRTSLVTKVTNQLPRYKYALLYNNYI
jgi:hypothetical protein